MVLSRSAENTPTTQAQSISTSENEALDSIAINRQILKEVSDLYVKSGSQRVVGREDEHGRSRQSSQSSDSATLGLRSIGAHLNIPVGPVHRKASVMVIGNISAGKSTFINWYVQEAVQRTGMAIETSGFTYVTSGRCLNELGGESTVAQRPHLQKFVDRYKGFLENLSLKTCPSKDGRLQLVDLIDTPGLADGELQYPFNVEEVIVEMRHYVDLYFVFFDPIGQALGRRVLSVVKHLNDYCPDKLRFCLTKIDDVRSEEERIKILCQTTQSLTAKINSRHGFDLVPVFVPGAKAGTYVYDDARSQKEESGPPTVNRIWDLVSDINRVTERRVQDCLNALNTDTGKLTAELDRIIEVDSRIKSESKQQEWSSYRRYFLRSVFLVLMAVFAFLQVRASAVGITMLSSMDGWLEKNSSVAFSILSQIIAFLQAYRVSEVVWTILVLLFASTYTFKGSNSVKSLGRQDVAVLLEHKEYLKNARKRWHQLNRMYLDHRMDDALSQSSC